MLSWGPPHFPLDTAPEKYRKIYEENDIILRPNVPRHLQEKAKEELRGYYAHIAALDDAFAIVRKAIINAGIDKNTIFVFTSDHGDMRQSQGLPTKLFPFDESVCVPFLLRIPTLENSDNSVSPIPIDAPDIMPTLLGLCNLPIPPTVEGTDWSPFILGKKILTGNESAFLNIPAEFTEILRHGMKAYRGFRSVNYTYVRNTDGPWLLYDNIDDPYQMRNLIKSANKKLLDECEAKLQEHLRKRHDEFLDGKTYLKRAGLTHYGEVNVKCKTIWHDPWEAATTNI